MKTIAIFIIDLWRVLISPTYSWTKCCKYEPSCSAYAREAFYRHGFMKGLKLSFLRICRCNPWSKGGSDPCPN